MTVCESRMGQDQGRLEPELPPQQQVGPGPPGLPRRQPGFNCPWRGWGSGELSAAL